MVGSREIHFDEVAHNRCLADCTGPGVVVTLIRFEPELMIVLADRYRSVGQVRAARSRQRSGCDGRRLWDEEVELD